MGRDMTENKKLFQMPGIKPALDGLEKQLNASRSYLDHILIRGPRGIGKSYFVQIVKKHFQHCSEILTCDCENISKNELNEWLQYDQHEGRLIILDQLEELNQDDYRFLKVLMKKVRVVGVIRDDNSQLPHEFLENFMITIDVPSLYEHRADILYFLARKWPRHNISNMALMCMCAYHWPGNFRELNRAAQQWFSTGKLPKEIEKESEFRNIFIPILDSGFDFSELKLVIETCFKYVIPPLDEFPFRGLKLRYVGNDNSYDIEFLLDQNAPLEPGFSIGENSPTTILNEQEIQLIFKSFFQLVFGEFTMLHNENLFELEPFRENSLIIIAWYQREIDRWEIGSPGSSCSMLEGSYPPTVSSFGNSFCTLPHFEKNLTQEQLDAVKNFLVACKTVCEQNIDKTRGDISQDKASEVYEKQVRDEAKEKKFEQDLYDKNHSSTTSGFGRESEDVSGVKINNKHYDGWNNIKNAFKARGFHRSEKQLRRYFQQGILIITFPNDRTPCLEESDLIDFLEKRYKKEKK